VWKNKSKSFFNTQPDFRLFLNEYVRKAFSFYDNIPYGYRDMGIPAEWLQPEMNHPEKEYDFIYTGDCSPFRELERLLNCFSTGALQQHSLLIVGKDYEPLQEVYRQHSNIMFTGPVPYNDIPTWLRKARYGINFIADKEPINRQTSTKLLDYAACGLPVITTRYQWMEQFHQRQGGNYFYLSPDLSNFNWEAIKQFDYASPDLAEWTWDKQIRKSGVLEFLKARFPEIGF
jgi:glycosyltransferase involved in cell wall biosynthesis